MLLKFAVVVLLAISVAACSGMPETTHFQRAVIADSVTSYAGLTRRNVEELNPIFKDSSPATVALGGGALSFGMQWAAKKLMSRRDCLVFTRILTAGKYGAAANNAGVIFDAGKAAVAAGLATGFYAYNKLPYESSDCD